MSTFLFDGHVFEVNAEILPLLYLIYQARRGDAVAASLLDGSGVTIYDTMSHPYWPVAGEGR